jgi:anti-sigma B factor antagonist
MSTLSLTVRPEADATVLIHPYGEIDADNAHEIRDAVSGLLATSKPPSIVIDMSGVSFIDSVGIGALVGCYHAAAASDIRLLVTNPTDYVHRVLYVSGLLGLFGSPARSPEPSGASDEMVQPRAVGRVH